MRDRSNVTHPFSPPVHWGAWLFALPLVLLAGCRVPLEQEVADKGPQYPARRRTKARATIVVTFLLVSIFTACQDPNSSGNPSYEWSLLGLEEESITAIAVDPSDENIIYAGSTINYIADEFGGLFKSIDGGANWDTLISSTIIRDIDIHPTNPQIIYVLGGGALVSKTADGGRTWVAADSGLRVGLYGVPGVLAIDPLHPDTLYTGVSSNFGGNLFKSTDGGQTWLGIGGDMELEGVTALALDQHHTNVVYAGTAGIGAIHKSTDGGGSWERLDFPEAEIVWDLLVHSSNSKIIYASRSHGGFYMSLDGGTSWRRTNTGLADTIVVYQIAISPGEQVYFAGYSDGEYAVYRSSPYTIQWTMVGDRSFEGRINTVHVSKKGAIFAGGEGIYTLSEAADHDDNQ